MDLIIKMNFLGDAKTIVDDMLVSSDPNEQPIPLDELEYTTMSDVEHYLDITIDREIPEIEVCRSINNLKARNIYLDIEYDCSKYMMDLNNMDVNLYRSPVEDIEDCE